MAVKDPWLWRQCVRAARRIAEQLPADALPSEASSLLAALAESDGRLEALEREQAFPAARLDELEQAHRERTARLRHAIIDLGLDRDREAERESHDADRLQDLEYQIRALEERLAREYQEGNAQSVGLAREVAQLETQREELQQERVATELTLLGHVMAARPAAVANPDAASSVQEKAREAYAELDALLSG